MKLTLNIDDALLTRVMETTGAKTKTAAIHAALAEVDRRNKLIALLSEDMEIDFDKDIDLNSWAEPLVVTPAKRTPATKRAPVRNDRKPRPRR